MKRIITGYLLAVLIVALAALTPAQEKAQPQHKMIEFHMALLKRGPKHDAAGMAKDLQSQHVANLMSLLESGKAVIAGPLRDDSDIAGIFILRAKSSEDVMKMPAMPI